MSSHNMPNEAAWQEFRRKLYRFVQRRVSSPEQAEDIVHDVLVRAYAQKDSLRNTSRWEAWLYQIARNVIVDHYRSSHSMEEVPESLHCEEKEQSGLTELAGCVEPLLQQLPERYQRPLALAALKGWKQADVAEHLDLSLSGAKSRIQRGRQMLKTMLLRCCEMEFDSQGHVSSATPRPSCTTCGCHPL